MKITKQQLRMIIREQLLLNDLTLERSALRTVSEDPIYLIESRNRIPTKFITFGALLERRGRGLISERKAVHLWERSINYELNQLLAEGVLDDLKGAYEAVKSGAKKISDAGKAAFEKVSDFIHTKSVQAYELARAGLEGGIKAARGLIEAVKKFQKAHPVLFKIGVFVGMTVVIFAVMSFIDTSEAQAAIEMKGGKMMSQERYEAVRGVLDEFGNTGGMDAQQYSGKAIVALDKAFKAKDAVSLNKIGGELNGLIKSSDKILEKLLDEATAGDRSAGKKLIQLMNVGKKLKVEVQ